MRCMGRNKQTLYYALSLGKDEIVDEYGNATGQYRIQYTEPIKVRMNISAARGTADIEQFGINSNYTRTLVTTDMQCPIDKDSIIWIGKEPDGETPHNYVVTQVAKSLNSITYAIKEVSVNG